MIQQAFERTVSLRKAGHLNQLHVQAALQESTFVFRRALILLYKQGHTELAHALSLLWKSAMTNIEAFLAVHDY